MDVFTGLLMVAATTAAALTIVRGAQTRRQDWRRVKEELGLTEAARSSDILYGRIDNFRLQLSRDRGLTEIVLQLTEPLPWELMAAYGGTVELVAENVRVFGDRLSATAPLVTADILINRVQKIRALAVEALEFHAVLAQKIQRRTSADHLFEERATALRALHTHFPRAAETQEALRSAAADPDPAYRLAAATATEDEAALRVIAIDRAVRGNLRVHALLLVARSPDRYPEAQNILIELLSSDELKNSFMYAPGRRRLTRAI